MLQFDVEGGGCRRGQFSFFFHFGRGPTIINKDAFFTPTLDSEVMD